MTLTVSHGQVNIEFWRVLSTGTGGDRVRLHSRISRAAVRGQTIGCSQKYGNRLMISALARLAPARGR
jgi:hypothetical protein